MMKILAKTFSICYTTQSFKTLLIPLLNDMKKKGLAEFFTTRLWKALSFLKSILQLKPFKPISWFSISFAVLLMAKTWSSLHFSVINWLKVRLGWEYGFENATSGSYFVRSGSKMAFHYSAQSRISSGSSFKIWGNSSNS